MGIVSAHGRSHPGINSKIFSPSGGSPGIGFAIPGSLARMVVEQIIKNGEVTRGWLGIEPQDLTAEAAQALAPALENSGGALIGALVRKGPANRAGIRTRDIVVAIDGKATRDTPVLLARIAELEPGSTCKVTVGRERRLVDVDVTVARRPRAP